MSISRKVRFLSLAGLVSLAGFVGCGSTDNNDQGTVFTAIGYYGATTGNTNAVDTANPIGRFSAFLSEPVGLLQSGPEIFSAYAWLGVSNNLATDNGRNPYIRVTRVSCSYDIPGSSFTVPNEEFAVGIIVEGITTSGNGGGGSGSGGGSGTGGESSGESTEKRSVGKAFSSTAYIPFPLLSSDIYAYLNNNRSGLPPLPFEMVATCNATGVTRSGETYTTNDLDITIDMVEFTEVNPVPSEEQSEVASLEDAV